MSAKTRGGKGTKHKFVSRELEAGALWDPFGVAKTNILFYGIGIPFQCRIRPTATDCPCNITLSTGGNQEGIALYIEKGCALVGMTGWEC